MFETILWATDGSELSDGALPIVRDLASAHDARIVVVHANQIVTGRFGGVPMYADEPDVEARLREQVAALREEGFDASLRIEPAIGQTPARAIARAARVFDADLIVVATHAYGIVGTLIAGSVAKSLLREAPCPVLSVPPAVREQAHA